MTKTHQEIKQPKDSVRYGLKFGDLRDDGFRFREYQKQNGVLTEAWMSPEAFLRRKEMMVFHSRKTQKERSARYALKNKDKIKAKGKTKESRARRREWERNKRTTDPAFAVKKTCRARMRNFVNAALCGKKWRTEEMLGCDIGTLIRHIEAQFKDGMSWKNRSMWHIDHIIPLHLVDVFNPQHMKVVCHYKNLRPLWASENLKRDYADVAEKVKSILELS